MSKKDFYISDNMPEIFIIFIILLFFVASLLTGCIEPKKNEIKTYEGKVLGYETRTEENRERFFGTTYTSDEYLVKIKTEDKILIFTIDDKYRIDGHSPMQVLNSFQEGKKVKFKADNYFNVESIAKEIK